MAHKTLIDGTAYEISGGKTLVGGTAHAIDKGKTLIGGTAYEVGFGTPVTITVITSGVSGSSPSQYRSGFTTLYHNEETYEQATTFQAYIGDTISCEVWVSSNGTGSSASIYLNNTKVATVNSNASSSQNDENTAKYDYTVVSDATIELEYAVASWYGGGFAGGRIYITET